LLPAIGGWYFLITAKGLPHKACQANEQLNRQHETLNTHCRVAPAKSDP